MSKKLFDQVAKDFSKKVATTYSTSFSIGISLLDQGIRDDIYAVYAFVRFADEIVDTFLYYDKRSLLDDFCKQTYLAVQLPFKKSTSFEILKRMPWG